MLIPAVIFCGCTNLSHTDAVMLFSDILIKIEIFYADLVFYLRLVMYTWQLQFFKSYKHKNIVFLNFCCVMMLYVFLCRSVCLFCTGHFVMVPLNLTYLHCLQHFCLNMSSIYIIQGEVNNMD